jgi:hypothetical protein
VTKKVRRSRGENGGDNDLTTPSADSAWESFRRAERREWWLWLAAIVKTTAQAPVLPASIPAPFDTKDCCRDSGALLLTVGMVSFIAPELAEHDWVYRGCLYAWD